MRQNSRQNRPIHGVEPEKRRKYVNSHPWLTFQLDTRKFDHEAWTLLGEAASKCAHIIGTPLLPDVHEKLMLLFMAKGAHATTAIEGNTLTEDEVKQHLKGELKLPPSKAYLGQEVDNIAEAFNLIGRSELEGESAHISVGDLQAYNRLVLRNLPLDKDVVPGKIREYSVEVGRYVGAPPEDLTYLLNYYVDWLNHEFPSPENQEMMFGILKAIVAHVYFEWIHPFGDGNGRTGRLIEFKILLSAGVPETAAHLLSNHYNQTRSQYYRNLEFASVSNGDLQPFIKYALRGFVDQLKIQIDTVKEQQLYTHWINHVHDSFKGKTSKKDARRKNLMLELSRASRNGGSSVVANLKHVSPVMAEEYAGISDRTYERDIAELKEMKLLLETPEGYRPNWDLLKGFMPSTKSKESKDKQMNLFETE